MDDEYMQPRGFILLRVSTGVLLFWLVKSSFKWEPIQRADLGRLMVCGLFGIAINQLCFFSGLKWTTPINASLIMTTTPILVLISSAFLIGERINIRKIIGIALGAAGAILLISYGKDVSFRSEQLRGDLLILINASSYGIYLVLVKSLMKKYQPLTVISWVFLFGWIVVLPFGWGELMAVDWSRFDKVIWWSVAYVLIFTTFFAYLLNTYALKTVTPTVVSIYIYLQPLLATLIALSIGKDELRLVQIISCLLIFSGVFLVSRPTSSG